MDNDKLGMLLNDLAEHNAEAAHPGLANDIKQNIPPDLASHRKGMDSIKIMIDLRVGRLTAAAAIIIATILLANLLNRRSSAGDGVYQELKVLTGYLLGDADEGSIAAGRTQYEYLLGKGREVVFYGEGVDWSDSNSVMMHCKLADGKYRIVFVNLHEQEISAEQLIEIQARMLQNTKK
jgi:hypothetical protein